MASFARSGAACASFLIVLPEIVITCEPQHAQWADSLSRLLATVIRHDSRALDTASRARGACVDLQRPAWAILKGVESWNLLVAADAS